MNNQQDNSYKYIAYYRKSTESDEKQVQSIPDQKAWAARVVAEQKLSVPLHLEESRSARTPGRPVFEQVVQAVETGRANAIVAYDASRLARNALDGARIINLLDSGKLRLIVTATSAFRNTSTDKFMLAFFFAQSKHYVDNLSEVVIRGMRSKANKGIFPGRAKIGYLNHPRTHEIVPDPETFPLVRKAFEMYATNRWALREMSELMFELGFKNESGLPLAKVQVAKFLDDPFYYGAFIWAGELYQGVHPPAISRELWDKVQRVRQSRTRPQSKFKYEFPFLGLLHCAECGGAITAETHTKHYKNGNSQTWRYYRCTKKAGEMICHQPFIREELLLEELLTGIQQIAIPDAWAEEMLEQVQRWELEEAANEASQLAELRLEIEKIAAKLRRLTDLHLDGELDRADYTARKRQLVNEKIALEARLKLVSHEGPYAWLEPLRSLINAVRERNLPTAGSDLLKLRDFVAEVGSNLKLNSRKVLWDWIPPYALLAQRDARKGWQP